jgi:hypothetical protein
MAETVGVFISYNHDDIRIALALKQCLLALSANLDVFVDHASLDPGDEYEAKLARYISKSQWFLLICSGPPRQERDMGWCFQEAGQFRAKLLNENKEDMIRSRLVAIHDDDRPRPISHFQSVKITSDNRLHQKLDLKQGSEDTSAFEDTEAFNLFKTIIERSAEKPLRDLTDQAARSLLRDQARRLIRAFVEEGTGHPEPEVVLQPRISCKLPPISKDALVALSDDIEITGDATSLRNIFGLMGTTTTWGAIKQRVRACDGRDPLWLTGIEAAALAVAKNRNPDQPGGLCEGATSDAFYRVIFDRYQPYRNGARICYVTFIPTRPRRFEVRKRASTLLSALILSIRFRQRALPFIETIKTASRTAKRDELLKFERELHEIETEALEFGLNLPRDEDDEQPLVQALREGEGKAFVDEAIKSWTVGRAAIAVAMSRLRTSDPEMTPAEAVAAAERIVVEELTKIRSVNGRFIEILTEEILFSEKVGLDAVAAGSASDRTASLVLTLNEYPDSLSKTADGRRG